MTRRRELLAGLAAGSLAGPAFGSAPKPLAGQPPLPRPLADFAGLPLTDLSGRTVRLGALVGRGRAAVVSFWAVWCAPCAQEGQHLAALRNRYPEGRLAIVGINVDAQNDAERQARFREKARMNYAQALDGRAAYVAFSGAAQIALPRAYVFDAAGRPVAAFGRFFGKRSLEAITAAVESAVQAA